MGAAESGRSFLDGFVAKLPEVFRAEAIALIEKIAAAPEAVPAIQYVGDGAMRQPDYSKAMNDMQAAKTELAQKLDNLNTWYEQNEAALKEYVEIKPEYDDLKAKGNGAPLPKPPAPPADPRKVVEEVLHEQGREYVALSAWLAGKAVEHLPRFGEPLDVMELTADPRLGKPVAGQPGRVFSLLDVYTAKYGERVATKQREADEAKLNAEVEKRLSAKLAERASQPFPLRGEAPSVLDVLNTKEGPATHTLDTAVAEYERLQGARGT